MNEKSSDIRKSEPRITTGVTVQVRKGSAAEREAGRRLIDDYARRRESSSPQKR